MYCFHLFRLYKMVSRDISELNVFQESTNDFDLNLLNDISETTVVCDNSTGILWNFVDELRAGNENSDDSFSESASLSSISSDFPSVNLSQHRLLALRIIDIAECLGIFQFDI